MLPNPQSPIPNPSSRRGVLLLLILALLAMFGLIAVAFVVLTGQAQRSARSIQRIDMASDPPKALLQQAAMQIFRGPNTPPAVVPTSVMGAHSLLETMYGNNWVAGTINNVTSVCGGQLLEFTFTRTAGSTTPSIRTGCVITVIDPNSPAMGQSSMIVGFNPNTPGNWQMLAFDGPTQPISGVSVTINGVPFSGTGFGYVGGAITNTAYQPNPIFNAEARNPAGGANSDYTAADYQHMLLAAQWRDDSGVMHVIPSMHRPALANVAGATPPHNYILRPLVTDHPNFTGSNPRAAGFDPVNGPWDVDNDGDGVPDSVWVDLGMPVRSTTDGRLYKPLFAILCLDLDGRLNLNAHGSLQQADPAGWYNTTTAPTTLGAGLTFAGGTAPAVHRGLGFGPAEINLSPVLTAAATTYQQLLIGTAAYEGRYGKSAQPGVASTADPLNFSRWFEYANCNYTDFSNVNNAGAYGTPPDPFGQGIVALDAVGRPMYLLMGGNTTDNPYESDLGLKAARGISSPSGVIPNKPNNLFSPAELERLLRPYDRDATGLPARLAALAPNLLQSTPASQTQRLSVTTESWDLPCPSVVTPQGSTRIAHITELLTARGVPPAAWLQLLPPEVLAGLKMNINRPLGNGTASANGVVNDPANTSENVTFPAATGNYPPVAFSYDGVGGALAANSLQGRQLQARYLYVLMCLVADTGYLKTQLGGQEEAARYLAQWAINAVDFRDRDSIMTPFDYDPAFVSATAWPTSWTPPADHTTHRVWGCKRPELLISETLAFHDRRTENTADEIPDPAEPSNAAQESGAKYDPAQTDPKKQDVSFDQSYRPQGSLFIELYNPSSSLEPKTGDLYNPYTGANAALDLAKRSGGASGSPVWRMLIAVPRPDAVNPDAEQPDPDDPISTAPQPSVEREVYFVSGTLPAAAPGCNVQFHPAATPTVTVQPGGYAVIGPGEPAGSKRTYIGFLKTKSAGDDTTRYIDLASPPTSPLIVRNNTNSPDDSGYSSRVNTPAVLAIDTPQRLSVTEPVDGYGPMETAGGPDATTGKYAVPYDIPFDGKRTDGAEAILPKDQTVQHYRVVYLQRLANPTAPYHATDNPYRTIDMMPIDVTAFNGVSDPAETDPANTGGQPIHFQARQRGESNDDPNRFWKQEPMVKSFGADAPNISGHNFNNGLKHSIGYLSQAFGPPQATAPYKGGPSQPFPWLTWNNRPYVSPLELLLVPALRSSKLLVNAGNNSSDVNYNNYFRLTSGAVNPYTPASLLAKTLTGVDVPYPHLLNFFQSSASSSSNSPQFHRILEYLGVPSWFTGSDIQIKPANALTGAHAFHPPYNRISTYREPGRINLNTIYQKEVFFGLMNGFPGMNTDAFWQKFVGSRQAENGAATSVVIGPVSGPSEFANPFRSYGGLSPTPLTKEINATLLRADPTSPTRALFEYNNTTTPAEETTRNPFFRYEGLQRLGNLVTTRSNVYAVWITVGYFEVSPASGAAYPDGLQLGRELGSDTGELERHRAFYIFDRSIPVGFQRGMDWNVEKAILVNRYIE